MRKFYPYLYTVQIVNGECINNPEYKQPALVNQSGIIPAETYIKAMARLVDYYGEEAIVSVVALTPIEDGPIVLPSNVVKNVFEDKYFNHVDKNEEVFKIV